MSSKNILLVLSIVSLLIFTKSVAQEVALANTLKEFENKYSVKIFYDAHWIDSVKVKPYKTTSNINQSLSVILANTSLDYFKYNEKIYIVYDKSLLPKDFKEIFLAGGSMEQIEINKNKIFSFNGKLIGSTTGDPIVGGSIYIQEKEIGITADQNGFFNTELVGGNYNLVVRAVGYQSFKQELFLFKDTTLEISLFEKVYQLDEVVVSAEVKDVNVSSTLAGVEKLDMKSFKKMPTFGGEADIIKGLLLMPGVSSVGEGSEGFNVRGGTIDQNLVLQDGAPLFNASHVLGFFSLFNTDLVQNATLFKGSIPAQYGGRVSSVLAVDLKEGNFEKPSVNGGIGSIFSKLSLQGPIQKNKSSFIVGARVFYPNYILKQFSVPDVKESAAFFYDINAKITQKIGSKNKISLAGYRSYDNFNFANDFYFDYSTSLLNLKWTSILNQILTSEFIAITGDYKSSIEEPEGNRAFKLDRKIGYSRFQENVGINLNEKIEFNLGFELNTYKISPGKTSPIGDISIVIPKTIEDENGRDASAYIQAEWLISNVFSLSAGLRYTAYQYIGPKSVLIYEADKPIKTENVIDTTYFSSKEVIVGYSNPEPRIGLNIKFDKSMSIKLGYNRTFQYLSQISNTASATPVDIWQLSNSHITPVKADNYSFGVFKNFIGNKFETSVEGYYRKIDRLIEYRELADLLANEHIETELLFGQGKNYGVEMSVKKKSGKLTGQIGYTYSRALRKVEGSIPSERINRGEWYPSNYDKPNNLTVVSTYQFNRRNSVSFNFVYNTGRPVSSASAKYSIDNFLNIPDFSGRNQTRIPDYHRLDVSYTLEPSHRTDKRWKSSWTLSIYNLYGRKNAYSVFFTQQRFQNPQAKKLTVLGAAFPSITYNFKF